MKTFRKRTACLALFALAACTARAETLADYLPADVPSLDIYAARDVFMAAVPYSPTALIGHSFTEHVAVTDAALRAETLKRLRAVRVVAFADGKAPRASCTHPGNSFGLWLLGNGTMLVIGTPVSDMQSAKDDEYTHACLQIGDESHRFKLSDADLWKALKPVWKGK